MSATFQPSLDFLSATEAAEDGQALIIDVDGYEGPLHALLALARTQKVDLLQISISALADQYLAFVREAKRLRFSLAADYLVMAAWLAYLKSRLLLPKAEKLRPDEQPAEEIAARLAFRLAKLDAMRQAVEALKDRQQLGRDVFGRGDPETVRIIPSQTFEGDLYGLMSAYISQRRREIERHYAPSAPTAYPLEEARDRLRSLLPDMERWTALSGVTPRRQGGAGPSEASFVASTLAASLELVKEGAMEAKQLEAFSEIYLRRREGAPEIAGALL